MPKEESKYHTKVSKHFIVILALVSIFSFLDIVGNTLFEKDIRYFVEAFMMILIGTGLILEVQIKRLTSIARQGLDQVNFTSLTTVIIGVIAVIAGIFSFPPIRINSPGFIAVKGILAIIAIAVIIVQTWIVKKPKE